MKSSMKIVGRLMFFVMMSFAVLSVACTAETGDQAGAENLIVYKSPTCGCCEKWIGHMESAGFNATVKELVDVTEVKNRFGIRPQHRSCHTAVSETGGFVFEGHIPASIVRRFLAAPPANAKGLIVPGMPVGSPGMESGNHRNPYDVLLLKADGNVEVYWHVDGNAGT